MGADPPDPRDAWEEPRGCSGEGGRQAGRQAGVSPAASNPKAKSSQTIARVVIPKAVFKWKLSVHAWYWISAIFIRLIN